MPEHKKNIFVARLARHAAATIVVGAGAVPANQTGPALAAPVAAQEFAAPNEAVCSGADSQASSMQGSFVLRFSPQMPSAWDKALEKEFRTLALSEAEGKLSDEQAHRLEVVSLWREQLESPQTAEEILLQIRRDRLIDRMQNLLEEYVEFKETANQARSSS
jgi:hypothetical protein